MSRRARARAAAIEAKRVALAPLPAGNEDDDEPEGWYACPSCGADTDPDTEDECWHCGEGL